MTLNALTRCAIGVALLLAGISPAFSAAVLHAAGGGTVRALVIGIDKYTNLRADAQLAGAVADARDVSGALAAAGVQVQALLDGDAVRTRVIAEMNHLIAESKSGDLAIIAYSGQGMLVRAYPQWEGLGASGTQAQIAMSRYSGNSVETAREIVVDREMRAWLARFDAKGVDVLVIMDASFGGAMRDIAPFAPGMKIRSLRADINDAIHDSFVGIPMSQREARADVKDLSHVTFFAGATERSVVPEWPGIDRNNPKAVRGALSFFMARAFEGLPWRSGEVTREQLFKFIGPNVRQTTDQFQMIAYEPRSESVEAQQKVVFRLGEATAPEIPRSVSDLKPPPGLQADPVGVAIANGPDGSFTEIAKGRAPFVRSEPSEAELVWNVGGGTALSRGDIVMSKIDGSMLGAVIDRTWAVREIEKLSRSRVLDIRLGEEGKSYRMGDHPVLRINDVRGRYLTVVNIAADGTVQMLFPFYENDDPHILTDSWRYAPAVTEPFGADVAVAVATRRPVTELMAWLTSHNLQRDGFDLPAVIARAIAADTDARVGTPGLYTTP